MDNIDNSVQKVIDLLERIPHNYAEITQRTPYYNMAATLTDSVLQAGMNYKSVVYPRVYNILSKYSDYRTTCDFIILFQTCLLYTSPSPRNPKTSRMPSSA